MACCHSLQSPKATQTITRHFTEHLQGDGTPVLTLTKARLQALPVKRLLESSRAMMMKACARDLRTRNVRGPVEARDLPLAMSAAVQLLPTHAPGDTLPKR